MLRGLASAVRPLAVYAYAMSDAKQEFEQIRDAVEAADRALAEALAARAKAVTKLAALRSRASDAYFTLPRDVDVLTRAVERVDGLPKEATHTVMKEVLSACNALIAPAQVVYAGQEGGLGNVAARKQFGASAVLRSVESPEAMLSEIARGRASFGVLPFESSHDGAVTQTLNLLARSEIKVCAEIPTRRSFHLLSKSGDRTQIKRIYAATSALAACERYLAQKFPERASWMFAVTRSLHHVHWLSLKRLRSAPTWRCPRRASQWSRNPSRTLRTSTRGTSQLAMTTRRAPVAIGPRW
jgi:chorismate mutase